MNSKKTAIIAVAVLAIVISSLGAVSAFELFGMDLFGGPTTDFDNKFMSGTFTGDVTQNNISEDNLTKGWTDSYEDKEHKVTYNISTVFDTYGVPRPNYAWENTKWGKEASVKEVFDDLFTNILPAVRGVYAGDMTITDLQGNDTKIWEHKMFNQSGWKTGLAPTARFIRLYLTCQPEPIYVNIGNLLEEITNGYNVASSETVRFEVDDLNNTLYAHINVINDSQLTELGIKDNEEEIIN